MGRLGRIKKCTGAIAPGEFGGGHVGPIQNISLLNSGVVKEDWEANGVEKDDNLRIRSHERARWHVAPEHCGVVFLHSNLEEIG